MDNEETTLLESMRSARKEYWQLAETWDSILVRALDSAHGSSEMVQGLLEAQNPNPAVTKALERYGKTIDALQRFYSGRTRQ